MFAVLSLAACTPEQAAVQLSGVCMGTTWHVTYIEPPAGSDQEALQRGIEQRLEQVESSMSTYREDSEITRFNASAPHRWFEVSSDFYTVLSTAMVVGRESHGAFDVTVAPLVDLWGFGPGRVVDVPPEQELIAQLVSQVGQDNLRLDGESRAVMKLTELSLDFSSLAKGYAVDLVSLWLLEQGVGRFLVEVGGEVRLSGASGRGDPWRLAIEQPESGRRSIATAISLTDVAVATSGDYRNFFEVDGRRYSHSIDPRTGRPVEHDLASVTVVHPSAMLADAWATALTVIGAEQGMMVAQAQGLAVYFIRSSGGEFSSSHSAAFARYLDAAQ